MFGWLRKAKEWLFGTPVDPFDALVAEMKWRLAAGEPHSLPIGVTADEAANDDARGPTRRRRRRPVKSKNKKRPRKKKKR